LEKGVALGFDLNEQLTFKVGLLDRLGNVVTENFGSSKCIAINSSCNINNNSKHKSKNNISNMEAKAAGMTAATASTALARITASKEIELIVIAPKRAEKLEQH
jgi:hypothetical protein